MTFGLEMKIEPGSLQNTGQSFQRLILYFSVVRFVCYDLW